MYQFMYCSPLEAHRKEDTQKKQFSTPWGKYHPLENAFNSVWDINNNKARSLAGSMGGT